MKTAMQELYLDLEKFKDVTDTISITDVQRMIGHYTLEKERQQIIEANRAGIDMIVNKEGFITGEDYYNETYD